MGDACLSTGVIAMQDRLTVKVPDSLRNRVRAIADRRGETVSEVVRSALWEYVAAVEPEQPKPASGEWTPKTLLGRKLWEIRARGLVTSPSLDSWDDLLRELADRRGERQYAETDIR